MIVFLGHFREEEEKEAEEVDEEEVTSVSTILNILGIVMEKGESKYFNVTSVIHVRHKKSWHSF